MKSTEDGARAEHEVLERFCGLVMARDKPISVHARYQPPLPEPRLEEQYKAFIKIAMGYDQQSKKRLPHAVEEMPLLERKQILLNDIENALKGFCKEPPAEGHAVGWATETADHMERERYVKTRIKDDADFIDFINKNKRLYDSNLGEFMAGALKCIGETSPNKKLRILQYLLPDKYEAEVTQGLNFLVKGAVSELSQEKVFSVDFAQLEKTFNGRKSLDESLLAYHQDNPVIASLRRCDYAASLSALKNLNLKTIESKIDSPFPRRLSPPVTAPDIAPTNVEAAAAPAPAVVVAAPAPAPAVVVAAPAPAPAVAAVAPAPAPAVVAPDPAPAPAVAAAAPAPAPAVVAPDPAPVEIIEDSHGAGVHAGVSQRSKSRESSSGNTSPLREQLSAIVHESDEDVTPRGGGIFNWCRRKKPEEGKSLDDEDNSSKRGFFSRCRRGKRDDVKSL